MASSRLRTIHGVLVRVSGTGILLIGDSGTGKTSCALRLIAAGHQLIADDVIELRVKDGGLVGNPPDGFGGVANVRPLGLVDLRLAFGITAVAESSPIDIVIRLTPTNDEKRERRFEDFYGFPVLFYDHQPDRDGELTTFVEEIGASEAFIRSH